MKLIKKKISELKLGTYQPRKDYGKEDSEKLYESLKSDSKNVYIEVDNENNVVDGHNLTNACKRLGKKDIWCLVKDFNGNKADRLLSALRSNTVRKNLSPYEVAESLVKIKKAYGLKTHKELAKKVGLTETAVTFSLKYVNVPEDLKNNDMLSNRQAVEIADIKDKKEQKQVAELSKGKTILETKKLLKTVRNSPEQVKKAILNDEITPEEAEDIISIQDETRQKEALNSTIRHKEESKKYRTHLKKEDKPVRVVEKTKEEKVKEAMEDLIIKVHDKTFDVGLQADNCADVMGTLLNLTVSNLGNTLRVIKHLKPETKEDILGCIIVMNKRIEELDIITKKVMSELR